MQYSYNDPRCINPAITILAYIFSVNMYFPQLLQKDASG
jgi:hypothetical protein